jgi:hypothetical protein
MVAQASLWIKRPDFPAKVKEPGFVVSDGLWRKGKFFGNFLVAQAVCEGLQDFPFTGGELLNNLLTACLFLIIDSLVLLCLCHLKGISMMVNIGPQRKKWALNQFDACMGSGMHDLALIGLFFDGFGCIQMPDVIVAIEVERGYGDG